MRAVDAMKNLKRFPGIDGIPQMHQEARYRESVPYKRGNRRGKIQACVFKRVYYVSIESFYETGNTESWVIVRTGDRSTPESAMKEWNRLVEKVRKEARGE